MKQNFQLMLDKTVENVLREGKKPKLLLHACCAPCSSYVLEYLSSIFDITLFYYNPNISPRDEYDTRYSELHRLVLDMGLSENIKFEEAEYTPELFLQIASGLEELPEGGERCKRCYALRLRATAEKAKKGGYDYFTTTLSISPYKNAQWLCEIGGQLASEFGVEYLYSDFKKKNGYKRSIELSQKYGLYRQDYCGCIYSKRDREKAIREKMTLPENR